MTYHSLLYTQKQTWITYIYPSNPNVTEFAQFVKAMVLLPPNANIYRLSNIQDFFIFGYSQVNTWRLWQHSFFFQRNARKTLYKFICVVHLRPKSFLDGFPSNVHSARSQHNFQQFRSRKSQLKRKLIQLIRNCFCQHKVVSLFCFAVFKNFRFLRSLNHWMSYIHNSTILAYMTSLTWDCIIKQVCIELNCYPKAKHLWQEVSHLFFMSFYSYKVGTFNHEYTA